MGDETTAVPPTLRMGCGASALVEIAAGPPPPGSNVEGYLKPGGAADKYLRSLWVKTGASKGIDDGVDQGDVSAVIGQNGRSLLGGKERKIPYQVVISFPGAGFDFKFVDGDGVSQASDGYHLAVAVRDW